MMQAKLEKAGKFRPEKYRDSKILLIVRLNLLRLRSTVLPQIKSGVK
jgi:hypothetical protein